MGRRQFTVRTLLVWMVVFALLCGALSASGVPLPLFVILFSLVAVVWLATLFCPPRVACGISVGIGTILGVPGGIAVIQPSRSPGPSLGEQVFLAVVIVMFFAAFGVSLYGAIVFVNRLIERDDDRDEGDAGQDRGGSDG